MGTFTYLAGLFVPSPPAQQRTLRIPARSCPCKRTLRRSRVTEKRTSTAAPLWTGDHCTYESFHDTTDEEWSESLETVQQEFCFQLNRSSATANWKSKIVQWRQIWYWLIEHTIQQKLFLSGKNRNCKSAYIKIGRFPFSEKVWAIRSGSKCAETYL